MPGARWVCSDYRIVNNLTIAQGAFVNDGHVRGASQVAVLGSNLATELFGNGQAVGQTVRIAGQPLVVIGVLTSKGSGGFGSVDDQVLMPITVAQQRLFSGRTPSGNGWRVSSIQLSVTDSKDIDTVQARITTLLHDSGATCMAPGPPSSCCVTARPAISTVISTVRWAGRTLAALSTTA